MAKDPYVESSACAARAGARWLPLITELTRQLRTYSLYPDTSDSISIAPLLPATISPTTLVKDHQPPEPCLHHPSPRASRRKFTNQTPDLDRPCGSTSPGMANGRRGDTLVRTLALRDPKFGALVWVQGPGSADHFREIQ